MKSSANRIVNSAHVMGVTYGDHDDVRAALHIPSVAGESKFIHESLLKQKRNLEARRLAMKTFTIFGVYATVRYNIFNNVPWQDWPVFVLNKIVALTSLALLLVTVTNYFLRKEAFNGKVLYYSGIFALVHSLVSIVILSPLYYPKLYLDNKLTFAAASSLLLGIVVMAFFYLGGKNAKSRSPLLRINSISVIAFFTGAHAALLGFDSWTTPQSWPGFLPPLTLISFVMGSVAVGVVILRGRSSQGNELSKN